MSQKVYAEELEADTLQQLHDLHEQCVAQMMTDPRLTDEEKQELLRQLELPDEEWEPVKLPEGAELISETIIKMRRGE